MKYRMAVTAIVFVILFLFLAMNPKPVPQQPASTRFVKIDKNGQAISTWSGPWQCVWDRQTGLLWEVKSYVEDLHDMQCSFSWYDGEKGVPKKGDCFDSEKGSDTYDLMQVSNQEKRCGVEGWRVPSASELTTLISRHPLPGDVLIDRDFFPYAKRGTYWSSDAGKVLRGHYAYLKEGAVAVDFLTGKTRVMPYRDATFVRLVSDRYREKQD